MATTTKKKKAVSKSAKNLMEKAKRSRSILAGFGATTKRKTRGLTGREKTKLY